MNLNYDPTPAALLALIASSDSSLEVHNLAIDYDGEVIIDPEVYYPNIPIDRYKVSTCVRDISLHNVDMVRALCRSLLTIFEKDMYYMDTRSGDMRIAA